MPSTNSSSSRSASGSTSRTAIVPGMMGVYNQLLGLNQQNYGNIISGYGNAQAMLANQMNSIYGGYNELMGQTMKMLGVDGGGWGVATAAANAIRQGSTQTQGQTQQAMINAGLGNTTVLQSATNQNRLQTNQAYSELGTQLADKAANYMTQIGLARQQAAVQITGMQSNLAGSYLNDLSGYRFQNTAGDLTGQFSNSWSNSSSQSAGMAVENPMMAGRGGGGGGGGGITSRASDPYFGGGGAPYTPYVPDLQAINYQANRPQSAYSGGSNQVQLSGGYADPRLWAGGSQAGRTGGGAAGYDVSRVA